MVALFLSLLMIGSGLLALPMGNLRVTKNLRVSGTFGRTLGIILLLGGLASLFVGPFSFPVLALVIAMGLPRAEAVGTGMLASLLDRSPTYRGLMGVAIGVGVALFALLFPVLVLAVFGPTIGQLFLNLTGQ